VAVPDGPGCAVAVDKDGRRLLDRAYGAAELEHGAPNTPQTLFEAGSAAKQFTAAAVLLLARDGRLSLADDVRRHLPELPDYGRPITVDQLLHHTSGLRDWRYVAAVAGDRLGSHVHDNADALEIAARQRSLNHAPGEAYAYTNTGYSLLAIIVERVTAGRWRPSPGRASSSRWAWGPRAGATTSGGSRRGGRSPMAARARPMCRTCRSRTPTARAGC
jgi:CubicO group peptidase (beta-lactamase class C family)